MQATTQYCISENGFFINRSENFIAQEIFMPDVWASKLLVTNKHVCWYGTELWGVAQAAPAAGVTRLGMEAKKEENLPDWYSQVTSYTFFHVQYSRKSYVWQRNAMSVGE
jgi:hypothetical protein